MIGEYRFLRTLGGITSFAAVSVVSRPAEKMQVLWDPSLSQLQPIFRFAVDQGLKLAFHEHQRRGGSEQAVEVIKLAQAPVDTRPDAVRCAATIAAWKSWGHSENELTISNDRGEWIVVFNTVPAGEQNP